MRRLAALLAASMLATILAASGCTAPAPKADSPQSATADAAWSTQADAAQPTKADTPVSQSDAAHDARNSIDWAGSYRGTLPCADCPGIESVVTLASDATYRTQSRYLGKGRQVFREQGTFSWNEAGNTITFEGREPARYFVGENRLTRLAPDGSRITGQLADRYVLTRIADGLTEKYWKLVELNGRPVPALAREPYLILKAKGGRVSGFGGCNPFTATYDFDEAASRIRFRKLAVNTMVCASSLEMEEAFHQVLRTVDNYSLDGDRLTLNRARMAPLARFEAVYLR